MNETSIFPDIKNISWYYGRNDQISWYQNYFLTILYSRRNLQISRYQKYSLMILWNLQLSIFLKIFSDDIMEDTSIFTYQKYFLILWKKLLNVQIIIIFPDNIMNETSKFPDIKNIFLWYYGINHQNSRYQKYFLMIVSETTKFRDTKNISKWRL